MNMTSLVKGKAEHLSESYGNIKGASGTSGTSRTITPNHDKSWIVESEVELCPSQGIIYTHLHTASHPGFI